MNMKLNKNTRFSLKIALIMSAIMLCIVGCGSHNAVESNSSYSAGNTRMSSTMLAMPETESDTYTFTADYIDEDGTAVITSLDSGMVKASIEPVIIRSAELTAEVESLEEFNDSLEMSIVEHKGYIESVSEEYEESTGVRSCYYSIRIYSTYLDDFLSVIENGTTVKSKYISSNDVTTEYIDIKEHIKALESERETLNGLLEQADSVTEVVELYDRITNINYELDSLNSSREYLESRSEYSTVNITVSEPCDNSVSFGEAFKNQFSDASRIIAELLANSIMFIIGLTVILVFLGLILICISLLIKKFPVHQKETNKPVETTPAPPKPEPSVSVNETNKPFKDLNES